MFSTRWFVAAAPLALAPPWALAQDGASAPTALPTNPLNTGAAVPAIAVSRAFDSYHAYHDTGSSSQRGTNVAVSPRPGGTARGSYAGHSLPASASPTSSNKPASEPTLGMHHR